jgi:hypothetical protein
MADKGRVYERMANQYAKQGKNREAAIQIRDYLRNFRMQRAQALVMSSMEPGANQSSSPMSAISAMDNQYAFGTNFTDAQLYLQQQVQRYTKKAGNAYNSSKQGFAMLDAAASAASSFGKAKGSFGAPSSSTTSGFSSSGPWASGYQFGSSNGT